MSQKVPFVSIAKEYTEGFDSPPWEVSFFLASALSFKFTAGAFPKDMIPGNEFSF